MAEIVAKSADPIDAIKKLGVILTKSQMIGPTDRVEQGESLALVCVTTGMDPLELSRNYQLSFGRLEKKIDSAVADFLAKGGKIEWLDDGTGGVKARAKFSINGDSVEATCMYEEAVKAGWTKNKKWETERPTMLRARVKKRGVLALAPEIFCGEVDDSGGDMTALPQAEPVKMAAAAQSAAEQSRAHAPKPAAPPAPMPAPAPAPAASEAPKQVQPPAELAPDLQEKLLGIVGDKAALATLWARSVGWLPADGTLEQLSEKNAKAILAKPDAFKGRLAEFEAKGGGK